MYKPVDRTYKMEPSKIRNICTGKTDYLMENSVQNIINESERQDFIVAEKKTGLSSCAPAYIEGSRGPDVTWYFLEHRMPFLKLPAVTHGGDG